MLSRQSYAFAETLVRRQMDLSYPLHSGTHYGKHNLFSSGYHIVGCFSLFFDFLCQRSEKEQTDVQQTKMVKENIMTTQA
ncbi:hypothetical protein TMSI_17860 [Klebsiella quasipneumoniae]|nr:hypothetical protein TMSI_17860 [Klebsiella quasipneumoniae]